MLLPLLALLALPFCLAAPKESEHDQLVALANANNGVIKLDPRTYDLLTSPKRTWSATVQLTALNPNMKCEPCRNFEPTFKTVAKAWAGVPKEQRDQHFFASLDFQEGQEIFKRLMISTAPLVYLFPSVQGPHRPASGKVEPFTYDFNNFGSDAVELAHQISVITPVPVPYKAPINWGFVGTVFTSVLVTALAARFSLPIILSRWTWAILTIGVSLIMTSGFMFVRIRDMPYSSREGNMMPGFQTQLGAEIWTISFTYFALAFAWTALILLVPTQTSEKRQRFGLYLFSGVTMFLYALLLQYFRVKNSGYPFRLFL